MQRTDQPADNPTQGGSTAQQCWEPDDHDRQAELADCRRHFLELVSEYHQLGAWWTTHLADAPDCVIRACIIRESIAIPSRLATWLEALDGLAGEW